MHIEERNFRDVFEGIEAPAFFCDSEFKIISANKAYCKIAGVLPESIIGKVYWEVIPVDRQHLEEFRFQTHPSEKFSNNIQFKLGNKVFHSCEYKIDSGTNNLPIYFHVLADISEATLVKESLKEIAAKEKVLFEKNTDAVILLRDCAIVDFNPAAITMFGCSNRNDILCRELIINFMPSEQPGGENSAELMVGNIAKANQQGSNNFEFTFCKKDGSQFSSQVQLLSFDWNGKRLVQAAIRDMSIQQASIAHLSDIAFKDPLTQLSTRRLMDDRLHQVQLKSERTKQYAALFYIDLDKFKRLNDLFGHHVGDLRLQDVASRITSCVRSEDTVARMGGDEFAVLINELSPELDLAKPNVIHLAEKLVKALSAQACLECHDHKPCELKDPTQCVCSASIGIVLFSGCHQTTENILNQADEAMYLSKKAGGNQYCIYESKA